MIIETKTQLDIENIGTDTKSLEANIDTASLPFLFEILSGSFYSNPIGSICREITSNCFDSHVEANVNEPVVVKKGHDEEGIYLSFIDVGVGLSPERIQNIYMNYFSSTKRETNTLIGGFGLGSKSPLSYTDYFYITTIYDNIKYQYIFSKGIFRPTIDLLDTSNCISHNGTEIRIYIKDSSDTLKFRNALSTQLCYFDNVYFDNWDIDNNYTIFEGKYFKYRNKNQYDSRMHIVLDKVVYPIDWKQLNMDEYNIAVGIKFKTGELLVTPNREQLQYTDDIIKLVKERIKDAIEELIGIFDKQNKNFDSFFEWLAKKDERPHIIFTDNSNNTYKLYLYGLEYVNKRNNYKYFEGIEYLANVNDLLSLFYGYAGTIKKGKTEKYNDYLDYTHTIRNKYSNYNCYIGTTSYLNAEKNWLIKDGFVFYPRINFDKYNHIFHGVSTYAGNHNLNSYYFNLGAGLKIYRLMKAIREEVSLKCGEYRNLTEDELTRYKDEKRLNNTSLQKRLQGKVFVNSISENESYDWNLNTDLSNSHTGNKPDIGINNYKGIVIYGFKEDQIKLEKVVDIFKLVRPNYFNTNIPYGKKFNVIKISKQNERYFKNKNNMTHINNVYGDNTIFRDVASLFKIECFFNDIETDSGQSTKEYIEAMKLISTDIGNTLDQLYNYYHDTKDERRLRYSKHTLKLEIVKIAKQFNLYNPNVELLFNKVNDWFKDVEVIRYININTKTLPYILKLLYEKKKKLNIEYYQRILNTDKSNQLTLDFNKNDTPITITKFNQITQNAII